MTQVRFEVETDGRQLAAATAMFEFAGGQTRDAIRIGINKTGPLVRTKASAAIRSQIRLKAGYVRDRLTFRRATRTNLVGVLGTPARGILLSRFSTDAAIASNGLKSSLLKAPPAPKRGIRVKVKPKGGTKSLGTRAFYMKLRNSGAIGIAVRRPNGETGPKGGRFQVFYGPSLSQVYSDVKDSVSAEASQIYTKEVASAMGFLLRKRYPRS